MIHLKTITDKMHKIAGMIFINLDKDYYLAGGTALSLQIGNRKSIDLDYFINKNIDTLKLKNDISDIFKDFKIEFTFEDKDTLWCIIDGVKVSFISRFDSLIEEVLVVDSFRLAQVKDITVMKLSAICGREEYKDYFDLACISTVTDSRSWNTWWQEVYKNNDPISYMIALSSVDNIIEIPLDIEDDFKTISTKNLIKKVTSEIKSFIL